mgnify:CR=1 FL=1
MRRGHRAEIPALHKRAEPVTAAILAARGGIAPAHQRGYHVEYRGDGSDRCPGCGRAHFYLGRLTAECAFCGTAVPLPETPRGGAGLIWRRGRAG